MFGRVPFANPYEQLFGGYPPFQQQYPFGVSPQQFGMTGAGSPWQSPQMTGIGPIGPLIPQQIGVPMGFGQQVYPPNPFEQIQNMQGIGGQYGVPMQQVPFGYGQGVSPLALMALSGGFQQGIPGGWGSQVGGVPQAFQQQQQYPLLQAFAQREQHPLLQAITGREQFPLLEAFGQREQHPLLQAILQREQHPLLQAITGREQFPLLQAMAAQQQYQNPWQSQYPGQSQFPLLQAIQQQRDPNVEYLTQIVNNPVVASNPILKGLVVKEILNRVVQQAPIKPVMSHESQQGQSVFGGVGSGMFGGQGVDPYSSWGTGTNPLFSSVTGPIV